MKDAKKDCEKVKEYVGKVLARLDEKELDEAEKDCCLCFNFMVESCLLPCRHRFCIQCIKAHLDYGANKKCPYCRASVPSYFQIQFY